MVSRRIDEGVQGVKSFWFTPVNALGEEICTSASGEPFEIELHSPLSDVMQDYISELQEARDIKGLKVMQRLRTEQLERAELGERFIEEMLEYNPLLTSDDEIRTAIKSWKNFPRCCHPETGLPLPDDQQPPTDCTPEAIDAFLKDNRRFARQVKVRYQQEKNSLRASRSALQKTSSITPSDNVGSTSRSQTEKGTSSPGAPTSERPIH